MRAISFVLAALLILTKISAGHAEVSVIFVQPDSYRDFSSEPTRLRDSVLDALRKTLIEAASHYLPAGQNLTINVFDVQRAGMFRDLTPSHTALLTPNTPPRFDLAYKLVEKGKLLLQARESVTDIDYFLDPSSHLSSDALVYEKQVLKNWLRKRFAEKIPPGE